MMKSAIIFIFLLSFPTLWSQQTANEIIERSQNNMRTSGVEAISKLRIINKRGSVRERKIAMISKLYDNGNTEKRLIRFLSPPDVKGTGMLTYDYLNKNDDIWIYLPALRKTRKILSSEKSGNFMGSEFTYGDMTFFSLDEFLFTKEPDEEVSGTKCFVIIQKPVSTQIEKDYGFSKKINYIGKEDYVIRKSKYFDRDNMLWKELEAYDIRLIDPDNSKYRVFKMSISNLKNNRKSEMLIEKLILSNDIEDNYFTSRYLERE